MNVREEVAFVVCILEITFEIRVKFYVYKFLEKYLLSLVIFGSILWQ